MELTGETKVAIAHTIILSTFNLRPTVVLLTFASSIQHQPFYHLKGLVLRIASNLPCPHVSHQKRFLRTGRYASSYT